MRAKLVRIGNSRGVRLPKHLIEELGLGEEVEIERVEDHLRIRPARRPRDGWAEAFEEMARRGDDRLLDADSLPATQWEESEWEW